MTPQEFTNLTGVEVSAHEFEAIHLVYVTSDYNKKEFCAAWCKMNKSRVERARMERNRDALILSIMDAAFEAYGKLNFLSGDEYNSPASRYLSTKEIRALNAIGVSLQATNSDGVRYIPTCGDLVLPLQNRIKDFREKGIDNFPINIAAWTETAFLG